MNRNTSENIVEAKGLVKEFDDGFRAVDDLSISVKKGEVFGFLGPNGAGKTTSIKMMVGLLKPTAGEVSIKGQKVTANSAVVKESVGVCPQEIIVWERLSCWDNLTYLGSFYDMDRNRINERATKLLTDLQILDKKNTLASALSGGMKRRLNLAMALMHEPAIVVLDEPSPGLDPQSRLILWEYIQSLPKEGKTVILTTHFMEEADRLSDRVAIIDHGKLLVLDTPENLKRSIGEGDVLEVTFEAGKIPTIQDSIKAIDGIDNVWCDEGVLYVRALNMVNHMPAIFRIIDQTDSSVINVRIRKNTLEDVFINLTGRSLREK